MKKAIIIVAVVIVAAGAALWYVLQAKPTDTPDASPSPSVVVSETPSPSASVQAQSPGKYVDYSDTIISTTTGTKLLFFHAPWCPQCRALEKDIQSTTLPEGVTVIKVDYDSHQDLRQKYGVTIQTTLVKVDDNGNLIEKYVAYNQPTVASVKQNLLDD